MREVVQVPPPEKKQLRSELLRRDVPVFPQIFIGQLAAAGNSDAADFLQHLGTIKSTTEAAFGSAFFVLRELGRRLVKDVPLSRSEVDLLLGARKFISDHLRTHQYDSPVLRVDEKVRALMFKHIAAVELSEGCSVGCPFCGFNVGPLAGMFSALDVMKMAVDYGMRVFAAHDIIFYYASEPFDWQAPRPSWFYRALEYPDIHFVLASLTERLAYVATSVPRGKEELVASIEGMEVSDRISVSFHTRNRIRRKVPQLLQLPVFTKKQGKGLYNVAINPDLSDRTRGRLLGPPAPHTRRLKSIGCLDGVIVSPAGLRNVLLLGACEALREGQFSVPIDPSRLHDPLPDSDVPLHELLKCGAVSNAKRHLASDNCVRDLEELPGQHFNVFRVTNFTGSKTYYVSANPKRYLNAVPMAEVDEELSRDDLFKSLDAVSGARSVSLCFGHYRSSRIHFSFPLELSAALRIDAASRKEPTILFRNHEPVKELLKLVGATIDAMHPEGSTLIDFLNTNRISGALSRAASNYLPQKFLGLADELIEACRGNPRFAADPLLVSHTNRDLAAALLLSAIAWSRHDTEQPDLKFAARREHAEAAARAWGDNTQIQVIAEKLAQPDSLIVTADFHPGSTVVSTQLIRGAIGRRQVWGERGFTGYKIWEPHRSHRDLERLFGVKRLALCTVGAADGLEGVAVLLEKQQALYLPPRLFRLLNQGIGNLYPKVTGAKLNGGMIPWDCLLPFADDSFLERSHYELLAEFAALSQEEMLPGIDGIRFREFQEAARALLADRTRSLPTLAAMYRWPHALSELHYAVHVNNCIAPGLKDLRARGVFAEERLFEEYSLEDIAEALSVHALRWTLVKHRRPDGLLWVERSDGSAYGESPEEIQAKITERFASSSNCEQRRRNVEAILEHLPPLALQPTLVSFSNPKTA